MTREFVRISEFARIAGMTVGSCYTYHAKGLHGFPTPDMTIGVVHFWRRSKAAAWARGRKKARRR